MTRLSFFILVLLTCLLGACAEQHTGVAIDDAWARSTAPGQEVGAAYMTLTSPTDTTLIKTESDVAGSMEIHSMTMKDGVMEMDMLENLPLKAGVASKLAPGGYHLMLFELKKPLKAGESATITLTFKDSAGKMSTQEVTVPIKTSTD